jgi:hypothetical protein
MRGWPSIEVRRGVAGGVATVTLPACRYRGAPNAEGRMPCTSPLLVCGHQGITAEHCERCPVVDKEASPLPLPQPRPLSQDPISLVRRYLAAAEHERRWRKSGGRMPTQEEVHQRIDICVACEHHDKQKNSCRLCGCYLIGTLLHVPPILLGKAEMATQQCPARKWGTVGGAPPAGCR